MKKRDAPAALLACDDGYPAENCEAEILCANVGTDARGDEGSANAVQGNPAPGSPALLGPPPDNQEDRSELHDKTGENFHAPNIVISRIVSAYFLRIPLLSAANAEEESAFFGGSSSQNRPFPQARKAILRASTAAAQVARSAGKSSAHAPKVTFS